MQDKDNDIDDDDEEIARRQSILSSLTSQIFCFGLIKRGASC